MNLTDTFERVVVINLKRRADRWQHFQDQLAVHGWPFRPPERYDAIDGQVVPIPIGFPAPDRSRGTWGCLQSQRHVLESAIMDGVESILVLEDDLCMKGPDAEKGRGTFLEECEKFFQAVPTDWDQLMLGGQHMGNNGVPIKTGVVKCLNCQRTHAYAIRGRMLRDLYAMWHSHRTITHCDHVMGPMQARYNVYAPAPFLFGQSRSQSDINGDANPTKFWTPPTGNEPVILLDCSKEVVQALRAEYGIHTGYKRDPKTDIDVGLVLAFSLPDPTAALRKWIVDLQWEVVSEEQITLAVWHHQATLDMVKKAWTGPVSLVKADTLEEAVAQLPNARKRPLQKSVIVLHASRQVAGLLRAVGWHMGNWRDPLTDLDNGLREWAVNRKPERLREVVDCLVREVIEGKASVAMKNGVACLWHPDLTADDVRPVTNLRVVEIHAESAEEAVLKWDEARGQ